MIGPDKVPETVPFKSTLFNGRAPLFGIASAFTDRSVDLQTGGEVTKGEVGVGVLVGVGDGPRHLP